MVEFSPTKLKVPRSNPGWLADEAVQAETVGQLLVQYRNLVIDGSGSISREIP